MMQLKGQRDDHALLSVSCFCFLYVYPKDQDVLRIIGRQPQTSTQSFLLRLCLSLAWLHTPNPILFKDLVAYLF